jgi:hypothetical protein
MSRAAVLAVLVASLAVFAASGVAAFAVYSWRWKADDPPPPAAVDEEVIARTYATEVALISQGELLSVEQITEGLWRMRFEGTGNNPPQCWALHLNEFNALRSPDDPVRGVGYLGSC